MRSVKRLFDLAVSLTALLFLSPIILLTALFVRFRLGSPILFTQRRPGLDAQPFRLLKFRTMSDRRGPSGEPLPDEQRLGPAGQFLRSWSLDELPQLVNIVKGEMSLVGPRPLLMEYVPLYSAEQFRRHEMPPGLTGLAQVSGRNAMSWEEKFALDVWYVDNWSFWLDLKILARTATRLFHRQSVSHSDHVTMPRFRGTKPRP